MNPAPPPWATEAVALAAPDPTWPDRAAAYAGEVADLLAGVRLDDVEHVGSTAVPGLVAKPIVDLMVRVPDPPGWCATHVGALEHRRWFLVPPELDRRPERRLLVRVDPPGEHRLAHLHVLVPGAARWHETLAFRDRLRADPALAGEYAWLKTTLARRYRDDREAYTDAKAEFVARTVS